MAGPPDEPAYRPLLEPLSSELETPLRDRVWLVPEKAEAVFLNELDWLGWHAHPAGEVDGLVVFEDPERETAP